MNGQILPKICIFGHFGPNIGIFGPFRPMPDQKNNANKVPRCFLPRCLGVPKLSPVKKGFFAQKQPNLAQNWHFWSFWARPCRLISCPIGLVGWWLWQAVSRKTPIYLRYSLFNFSQNRPYFLPKNDPIWPKIGIFVHCWLIWCPVVGLVGGCGARAVSRKTPIYLMIFM